MSKSNTFDYIVVGAGTAGCCIANRLSADDNVSVLLIEAGPRDTHPFIKDSLMPKLLAVWGDRNSTTNYPMKRKSNLGTRWRALTRGTMLGGCSSNNAMIHVRGDPRDFDNWADMGNKGWGYSDTLKYFMKSENYEGGASKYRGFEGPISVRMLPNPSPAADEFISVGSSLGFGGGRGVDFNEPPFHDKLGYFQFAINRDNTRCSSAEAYIHSVADRKNLKVLTEMRALALITEKKGAGECTVNGVECISELSGAVLKFFADAEVIVSGGAIGSPHLLLHSGIGPENHLNDVGIDVVHPLPVGENLHDHMILLLRFAANRALDNPMFISESSLFLELEGSSKFGADPSVKAGGWPTIQYFAHAGIKELNPKGADGDVPMPPNYLVMAPTMVRPKSRGSLTLASADPRVAPVIDPNYLTDPSDLAVMDASIELTRQFAEKNKLVDPKGPTNLPITSATKSERTQFIQQFARGLWHPVGTCKMGSSPEDGAVVDSELRVHGVNKLRVCDASIMPEVVAANTNPATLMIAEKAADMIA